MAAEDHSTRPSASDVLHLLKKWLDTIPYESMDSPVPAPRYPAWDPHVYAAEMKAVRQRREERKLAKEKAQLTFSTAVTTLDHVLDEWPSSREAGEDNWIHCVVS